MNESTVVVDQAEVVAADDPCAPFLTAYGRQLRVSAALDAVFEAKGFSRISSSGG